MYPFEKFSEDGKRTLTLAQEEGERAHHSYIGTEHLLLGLMRLESGPAHRVMTGLGISIVSVRKAIETVLGRNERILIQQIIPTSRVKQVIEISFQEARRLGHQSVDSGHILMALMIEGEGIAAHVLTDLGAGAELVLAAAEREMGVEPTEGGEELKSKRARMPLPGGSVLGPQTTLIARQASLPPTSDVETLHRLMRVPHIARLMRAKGVDVDALSKQLLEPPDVVLSLRQHLLSVRHAMGIAIGAQAYENAAKLQKEEMELIKNLEKAEQGWLQSLG